MRPADASPLLPSVMPIVSQESNAAFLLKLLTVARTHMHTYGHTLSYDIALINEYAHIVGRNSELEIAGLTLRVGASDVRAER